MKLLPIRSPTSSSSHSTKDDLCSRESSASEELQVALCPPAQPSLALPSPRPPSHPLAEPGSISRQVYLKFQLDGQETATSNNLGLWAINRRLVI